MTSFFVSYNRADKAWAEWIAWTLEDAGYTTIIQAWDFRPGGNFVLDMHQAAMDADKTLVVLSEDYLNAEFTQPEWAAAFADDPRSLDRKIIPIRVRECQPSGLLRPIVYVDLIDLAANAARQAILNALPERLKPDSEPPFPKTHQADKRNEQPAFPNKPAVRPWNVPYERNPFFIGREKILQTLHQHLNQNDTAVSYQTHVISGLGGIGKTQTAVEYVYRHRHDYQAVFWVRAETELELRTGFVEIGRLLDLPQKDAKDPNDIIRAVKRWLEQHSGWLLVFDNADHPEWLKLLRPRQAQGHILLTSRAQTFDSLGIARPITLEKMPSEEAVAFLFKRTGREADAPSEQAAAAELAEELGYLPLALEQAGAFILRRQLPFRTYLSQYRKQRLGLLEREKPQVGNELQSSRSLRTTWSLNFQAVQEINLASAQLLQFSAFVAPDAIPYELLIAGREFLGDMLANTLQAADKEEARFIIADILEPLAQYSLIRLDPENDSYNIHRLVQEVVKAEMNEESCCLWAERTIVAVTQAFPDVECGSWALCERLAPHAKMAMNLITAHQIESEAAALLLIRVGCYLDECAQYSEVEPIYFQALELRKKLFGDVHTSVAQSLNKLAIFYRFRGRYTEAEPLYLQALDMRRKLLGKEHLDVAQSLYDLAILNEFQGCYAEAEPLYLQALDMRHKLLGEEHPTVASSIYALADLYNSQERYVEAKPLLLKALGLFKQLLGDTHPSVASSLRGLARVYFSQGCFSEAERLYLQALEISQQFLEEDHPGIAINLHHLALLYKAQGRYAEAERFFLQALEMRQRLFGDKHLYVGRSLDNLAMFYTSQGDLEKAKSLYIEALSILEQSVGAKHLWTIRCRENLEILDNEQSG